MTENTDEVSLLPRRLFFFVKKVNEFSRFIDKRNTMI